MMTPNIFTQLWSVSLLPVEVEIYPSQTFSNSSLASLRWSSVSGDQMPWLWVDLRGSSNEMISRKAKKSAATLSELFKILGLTEAVCRFGTAAASCS